MNTRMLSGEKCWYDRYGIGVACLTEYDGPLRQCKCAVYKLCIDEIPSLVYEK